MQWNWKVALTLCASLLGGAAIMEALHAQSGPSALYVVDISEVTDAEAYKALGGRSNAEAADRVKAHGGQYVARTGNIKALDGVPPSRLIVQKFDNMQKAQAYAMSEEQQKIDAIRRKTTKSRAFLVEGL